MRHCPAPARWGNRKLPIRIVILAIGKQRRGALSDLQSLYLGRLNPPPAIVELEEKRKLPPAQLLAREAELILAALPPGARLVALDERGRDWTTMQLAQALPGWQQDGRDVAFVIGGADGLDPELKARADTLLRISSMTLPHGMVRVLLAEQLYRAWSITQNHPYHRA